MFSEKDIRQLVKTKISFEDISFERISFERMSFEGSSLEGISFEGISLKGIFLEGISLKGISFEDISIENNFHESVCILHCNLNVNMKRQVNINQWMDVCIKLVCACWD